MTAATCDRSNQRVDCVNISLEGIYKERTELACVGQI